MRNRVRVASVVVLLIVWMSTGVTLAVPSLQLYPPDATYDETTQTWVSTENTFELWVAGAQSPELVHMIEQVTLLIAVPNEYWGTHSPYITVKTITDNPLDGNPLAPAQVTLTAANLSSGPEPGMPDELSYFGSNFPGHGVYPARFWAVQLSSFLYPDSTPSFLDVSGAQETVHDYSPGGTGQDTGDIQYYEITTWAPWASDFLIHLDLIGFATNGLSQWRFAPFSHDAEAPGSPLPEPGTAVLLVAGLSTLVLRRSRRRPCRRRA